MYIFYGGLFFLLVYVNVNGKRDTGLKLLTSALFPAFCKGVTFAIVQDLGISASSKDKLKSWTTFSGIDKKASRSI